jgi:4-oxalocrotonate tautomerase
MPHLNLKFFPVINEEKKKELVNELQDAVIRVIGCDESVISIALEPIEEKSWQQKVYVPEIIGRKEFLYKTPSY